jgi:hypothetical protein
MGQTGVRRGAISSPTAVLERAAPNLAGQNIAACRRASTQSRARPSPTGHGRSFSRPLQRTGFIVLGIQLAAMLIFSTVEYQRFALTRDFATYSQAWWSIGHGVLDPRSSVLGVPFWRNNAEFAMWPLAFLYHVFPNSVLLLWLQDVVVVATELVAFRWIGEFVVEGGYAISVQTRYLVGAAALFALVANPWVYETIAFDFHFEAFAALFALLAAHSLWAGRTRKLWWWVPLAMLAGAFGAVYVVGVGISGVLASKRSRKPGGILVGAGVAWLGLLACIGAVGVGGTTLRASYGYLVPHHTGRIGVLDVVIGTLEHPSAAGHVVATHLGVTFGLLVTVGLIGLLSPWGIGVAAVVLVPNVLDSTGLFIRYEGAFQTWPAMPFVLVGSMMIILRLLERADGRRAAAALAAAWTTMATVLALGVIPRVTSEWIQVSPDAAAMLTRVQSSIPSDAEVVASQGVVGRFAARRSVYAFEKVGDEFPVDGHTMVFVLTAQQGVADSFAGAATAVAYVHNKLHTKLIGQREGVYVFAWEPPPGLRTVTLR